ncbi:MAG TPA: sensor histidine kinase [Acidimicrobiia bacterium]|nr:sensor histidine kinase [Acidimicrobiia bacterium]
MPLATWFRDRWQWVRQLNPWVLDAVLGTLFVLLGILTTGGDDATRIDPVRERDALAFLLILTTAAPFFFRRRLPAFTVIVVITSLGIYVSRGHYEGLLPTYLIVAMYTAGNYAETRRARFAAAYLVVVMAALLFTDAPGFDGGVFAGNAAIFLAAFFFGTSVKNRRLYTEELEARNVSLEREREEEARRAIADERLRIAQELHDVVAHSMGVIAVQAGVGAHVIDDDPAEAKRSLQAIAATSRSTLTELRRLLGVLRDDDGRAAHAPAPGLAALDQLAADLRGAGLPVELRVDGTPADVPTGVELAAYRIVQESLTNVLKHAGRASAQVVVACEPGVVRIEVVDDGRGVNGRGEGSGHGLLGMRERVAVYGGTLDAAPRVGGGFRVRAVLPYGVDE